MPLLEEIYQERKDDGFNIIGLVVDGKDSLEEAKFIAEKQKMTFANIIMEEALKEGLVSKITGTPSSLFVNSKGEIVGESILGGRDKETYDQSIDKVMAGQ